MKRKKKQAVQKENTQQIKNQKRYYYNEHDDNQVEELRHRRKKRRIKKRVAQFLKILAGVLIISFFVSPLSRVKRITVSGQHYLSEVVILENAGVTENSLHILTYPYFIEKNLADLPMVASVKVHRGFFNGIDIEVTERQVIAYRTVDEKLYVVDDAGQLTEVSQDLLTEVMQLPRLLGFEDDEILQTFCQQLAMVPSSTLSLMSDIVFNPIEPYDKTRVQIDMSDGKVAYVRIEDMASGMKYYQEMLSKEPNACIYDIEGTKVYVTPCP